MFSKGLIAAAEVENGGFVREYVKVGSVTKDKDSQRLTLTTSDEKVNTLIDFIN